MGRVNRPTKAEPVVKVLGGASTGQRSVKERQQRLEEFEPLLLFFTPNHCYKMLDDSIVDADGFETGGSLEEISLEELAEAYDEMLEHFYTLYFRKRGGRPPRHNAEAARRAYAREIQRGSPVKVALQAAKEAGGFRAESRLYRLISEQDWPRRNGKKHQP
jgi:hypothetical protein